MVPSMIEHAVTLWLQGDVPSRMVYAGRRWRVTDMPTRLRYSVWQVAAGASSGFYGWRFQATDDNDESFVFDVFPSAEGWHVHGMYA